MKLKKLEALLKKINFEKNLLFYKATTTFNFHGYKFTVLEINKNLITKISLARNLLTNNDVNVDKKLIS